MQVYSFSNLIHDLAFISSSLEKISKSLRLFISKLAYFFGIKQIRSNEVIPPIKIASLAYFVLLIQGVKHNYSYEDLYTYCILNKPKQTDYYAMVSLITVFNGIPILHNALSQYYYDQFSHNQEILVKANHSSVVSIDINKLSNTFSSFFISTRVDDLNITISLDYLVNDSKDIIRHFQNLSRLLTHLAQKGICNGFDYMYSIAQHIFIRSKLPQYSTSIVSSCISGYHILNPKQCTTKCYCFTKDIIRYASLPIQVSLSVYYPFENMALRIRSKCIRISANLRNSSFLFKEQLNSYISNECEKVRNLYGRTGVISTIKRNQADIDIDSRVVNVNRDWFNNLIRHLNISFIYEKAKDIIDTCYIKWLNDHDSFISLSAENKDSTSIKQVPFIHRIYDLDVQGSFSFIIENKERMNMRDINYDSNNGVNSRFCININK